MKRVAEKRGIFSLLGQSTMEYALLIAVVAAALIAMQVYVKRGIQGRIRDLADQISPVQYEQGRTDSAYTTVQGGTVVQSYDSGVSKTYQDGTEGSVPETITRSGHEVVEPEEYTN